VLRRLLIHIACAAATLAVVPAAFAAGGNYAFDGGTKAEQTQVTAALNASSFPWSIVPGPVAIHIGRGLASSASPNQIWLDADLLDAGSFSWGVVQHEYAHQVDFALLTPSTRAELHTLLGGSAWCGNGGEGHASLDCERFADLVAWSYWSSPDNVMKPLSATDEGGQVTPAVFRAALAAILPGVPVALKTEAKSIRTTSAAKRAAVKPRRKA
jgi:hypothetical protein